METEKSNVSKAEELKLLANEAFSARKYSQAIDLYTQAIELKSQSAVYWANRAFAHIRLEEYGSAIQDATKAIEVDPKYSKGYYRRGAAHLGLGKFKEALKDFQQVKKMCPNDPDATKKLKECEKAVMKLKFEEAIAAPEAERRSIAESIDYLSIGKGRNSSVPTEMAIAAVTVAVMAVVVMLFRSSMTIIVAAIVVGLLFLLGAFGWSGRNTDVESQYSGARIEGDIITLDFVKKMIDDFKNQKCLHKRYAYQIVLQTREILQALPSLVDINVPDGKHFTVCGDVHGQFYDLLNIFELNGLPSEENPYLFNGDFVDRGSFSLEVILTLFAFKCMSPSAIYLARGNHESKSMNKIYGFEGEVRSKLSDSFVELFAEVFCALPLAHVINQKVFVVHGGLFSVDGVKLSDLRAINRFCEPPEEGLMCELLWSDPQPLPGRGPSKRGVGLSFGADVTKRFLQENNLDLVVRSHEVKDEGYEIEHDGKLITVFSAPNYCDQGGDLRYCQKCSHYKPPRAHHCRVCKRCVLRMDHHCIWINNCVGHANYKVFFIFVMYAVIACVYSLVLLVGSVAYDDGIRDEEKNGDSFRTVYVVSGLLLVPLSIALCVLLGWHIYLILHNKTTIEYHEGVRALWLAEKGGSIYKHPYDLGPYENLTSVLGPNIPSWLWPTANHIGSGLKFHTVYDVTRDASISK